MSKFKKYLLLIPTAFIMLLNCMSFTAFADDEPEYLKYFISQEDLPELADSFIYDMDLDSNNPGYSKYLRYVDSANHTSYNDYISGSSGYLSFRVYYFDLTNVTIDSNSHQIITTNQIPYQVTEYEYRTSTDKIYPYSPTLKTSYIRYDYLTCYLGSSSNPMTLSDTLRSPNAYIFSIDTNHPDFPVPDYFGSSGGALNVEISVEPELSLNHRFSYSEASISPGFTLTVTNHSSRPIQYRMNIHTSDAALFYYYSYEWVYSEVNSQPAFVNKATAYHYVPAKSSDSVFFSYQHINFATNVLYYLQVEYGFSLSDSATELFTNGAEGDFSAHPYSDFAVERLNNNFILDFSFLDFPFLYKRPNSSDSPYLPYDSDIDRDRYNSSYNAKENDDGTIDYSGKAPDDFYVWDNNDIIYSSSSGVIGGSSSGSSNDGTFQSFASSFNGFFKFISYLFNYLPVGLKNLFLCGFTGIIVVAFVKKVF